jgi:hypothetical protein
MTTGSNEPVFLCALAGDQMESIRKNKELPLSTQFSALISLWSVWLLAAALVIWKDWTMRPLQMYSYPALIYSLLFVAFPLVLVAIGGMFVLHAPPAETLVHRVLWWFIACLNFSGLVMLLMGCALSLFFVQLQQVRE